MQKNAAQTICFCSLMVALAVLFQSAPVFLPAVGMAISPLASLPIALAAVKSKPYGVAAWLASTLILLIIYPQESAIFVCTTGLMGLFLGLHYTKKMYVSVGLSSIALFVGIIFLIYILQINVLGDIPQSPFVVSILIILAFSTVYTIAWAWIVRLAVAFLIKGKFIKPVQNPKK